MFFCSHRVPWRPWYFVDPSLYVNETSLLYQVLHPQSKVILCLIGSLHGWYQVAETLYNAVPAVSIIIAAAEWHHLALFEVAPRL